MQGNIPETAAQGIFGVKSKPNGKIFFFVSIYYHIKDVN